MSLVSSVQLTSFGEGHKRLWKRVGSEASQSVLHHIIYLTNSSSIVNKSYFL